MHQASFYFFVSVDGGLQPYLFVLRRSAVNGNLTPRNFNQQT